jgi:hypothetical protein
MKLLRLRRTAGGGTEVVTAAVVVALGSARRGPRALEV